MSIRLRHDEAIAIARDYMKDLDMTGLERKAFAILLGDKIADDKTPKEDLTRVYVIRESLDFKQEKVRMSVATASQAVASVMTVLAPELARSVQHYADQLLAGTRISTTTHVYYRAP